MSSRPVGDIVPGMRHNLQIGMVLMLWFVRRHREPTISDIQREFEVCRATAYRWRAAVRDVLARDTAAGKRPGEGIQ